MLFGSSKAHKDLRRILVEENKLDAVIKLPSGVFRPYAGVSTAILVFTKTGVGGTDHVWFYDVRADGWSLDDKRQPLLSDDKLGPTPEVALTEAEAAKNDLPDLVQALGDARRRRTRTPAHGAKLLRAEGRYCRGGLRPLAQPLQGSRARRGRARKPGRDLRRSSADRGGDCGGMKRLEEMVE